GQVHIATVNDYLAQRDREWMGPIYESLGLEVGVLSEDLSTEKRKQAYQADIVYGTAAQFGFDYLRDNMATHGEKRVQAERDFAIVDEIDSILIDEARTPLIISGPAQESTKLYRKFARLARRFQRNKDFEVDEKHQQITLTDEGANRAEDTLHVDDIYSPENIDFLHHLKQALRADNLFQKDEDYIVQDGRVVIVDEFTGRLMPDRRYSEGLHQALEAKEGMLVRREIQTYAQITLQNYFMLYNGLSGMTGTAKTEEEEFEEIYGMDVVAIPTNKPLRRDNRPDVIFKTREAKFEGIVDEIEKLHEKGRPVLVGTNAIEKSERLSKMLTKRSLNHEVLNAKQHAREAEIIKGAGQRGAITIATNMAGRGTDIVLGEGVAEVGGLHVLGVQRHESRRIDNQLRGRAGRQGDPGSSQFYLSLEDELLRIFGGERLDSVMEKVGMEEGQAIEHQLLTKTIRRAQKKVEGINFERRKQVLKYDKVMDRQRKAVYELRDQFLLSEDSSEEDWSSIEDYLRNLFEDYVEDLLEEYCSNELAPDQWDRSGLLQVLEQFENADLPAQQLPDKRSRVKDLLLEFLGDNWKNQKDRLVETENFSPHLVKALTLRIIDKHWQQHLYLIDDLKEGVGWSSYGGQDPLVEFKKESFRLFQNMLRRIRQEVVESLVQPQLELTSEKPQPLKTVSQSKLSYEHSGGTSALAETSGGEDPKRSTQSAATLENSEKNNPQQRIADEEPGRNDPCPCGSGKKYKYCCGRD
ncbi:MAG: preprotein translocase subunit SecA, partial [Candidatus Bipolaricaulota bacterium]